MHSFRVLKKFGAGDHLLVIIIYACRLSINAYRVLTNISPFAWAGMGVALCVSMSVIGAAA